MASEQQERARRWGRYLESVREQRGMSAKEAAERLGLSKNHIRKLELGEVADPSFAVIYDLAHLYGIPLADLVWQIWGRKLQDRPEAGMVEALERMGYHPAQAASIGHLLTGMLAALRELVTVGDRGNSAESTSWSGRGIAYPRDGGSRRTPDLLPVAAAIPSAN